MYFDQKYKDEENDQLLTIDESLFEGDKKMERIVRRLLMAACAITLLKQKVAIEQVAQMTTLSVDYVEELRVKLSE